MSAFTLRFETDNSAFGETMTDASLQTATILRELADLIEEQGLPADESEILRDPDGNTIGRYSHHEIGA